MKSAAFEQRNEAGDWLLSKINEEFGSEHFSQEEVLDALSPLSDDRRPTGGSEIFYNVPLCFENLVERELIETSDGIMFSISESGRSQLESTAHVTEMEYPEERENG